MNTNRTLWKVNAQLLRQDTAATMARALFSFTSDSANGRWADARHSAFIGHAAGHRFRALEIIHDQLEAAGATIRHLERVIDGVRI